MTALLENLTKLLKSKPTSFYDIFPVASISDKQILNKDFRVTVGFEMHLPEKESMTAAEIDLYNQAFVTAMQSLPEKAVVQQMHIYYHKPYVMNKADKNMYERKTGAHFSGRLALLHRAYLFISFGHEAQREATPVNNFFTLKKAFNADKLAEGLAARQATAEQLATDFADAISKSGVSLKRLGNEELEAVILQYLNLQFDSVPRGFSNAFHPENDCVVVGGKKCSVVTMTAQPSEVFNTTRSGGITVPFLNSLGDELQFPHLLITNYKVENTAKKLSSLDTQKKLQDTLANFSRQENRLQVQAIDNFTNEVRAEDLQIMSTNVTVLVPEANDAARIKNLARVEQAFPAGAGVLIENMNAASLFIANIPGCSFNNFRWLPNTVGKNAACYNLPVTTYQSKKGDVYLCDRMRNLLTFPLYNLDLNNQNALVLGQSGSGKTYTMLTIILQRFFQKTKQIIIDNGIENRSGYKSLVTALGGLFFEYNPDNPMRLAPLLAPTDEKGNYLVNEDKRNFLITLFTMIWKGRGGKLTQAELAVFSELIPAYYASLTETKAEANEETHAEPETTKKRRGKQVQASTLPSMTGFYEWIQEYKKVATHLKDQLRYFDMNEFILTLKPFAVGEYKDLFNASVEVDISDQDLICFDISKVKNPLLSGAVSLIITDLAYTQIRRFAKNLNFIYFDEAWSALSGGGNNNDGGFEDFLETGFRTMRRFGGGIYFITQGYKEILNSSIAPAIMDNSGTRIILNQQGRGEEDIQGLAAFMGLTKHEVDMLKSLRVSDTHREFLVKQQTSCKVFMIENAPSLDGLLSSKHVHHNYLQELIERYQGTLQQKIEYATEQFAEDKELKKGIFADS